MNKKEKSKKIDKSISDNLKEEMENKQDKNKKKTVRKWVLITALIIFGLALVGAVVWLLFFKQPSFTGENVEFEISGPSGVIAGDIATYEINYRNNEQVDLDNFEISLIYPDGFVFRTAEPKSQSFNDNKWTFDKIEAGEAGQIKIKGDLYGEVGSTLTAVANLAYKPKNVSSSFNQISESATKIDSLDLNLETDLPETIQKDKEFEFSITIDNPLDIDVENIRIEADLPDNFELISSEPIYKSSYKWNFPKIGAKKSEEIKITGKLAGEIGDKRDFKFKYGLFDGKDNFYLQGEEDYKIQLVDVSGDLKLLVNGADNNAKNPGELLEYTVFYKNTGSEALKNNVITLEFDNIELLGSEGVVIDRGELKGNQAEWSYEKIEELKNLDPGKEGTFIFKANIIDTIVVDDIDDKNFTIKAKPRHIASRGESNEQVSIEGSEAETKINSEIILTQEARYYDFEGQEVGSGPLPPKAGEETTYRIYLTLANRTNDVENGRVEIGLSDIAKWEGNSISSVGDVKFEGGKIIWDIGNIPANTGQFANSMTAEFDVSIKPTEEMVGDFAQIIREVKFNGSDDFTGNKIEVVNEGLDTSLPKDFLAQGKGEVSN